MGSSQEDSPHSREPGILTFCCDNPKITARTAHKTVQNPLNIWKCGARALSGYRARIARPRPRILLLSVCGGRCAAPDEISHGYNRRVVKCKGALSCSRMALS